MILLDAVSCHSRFDEPDYFLEVKPTDVRLEDKVSQVTLEVSSNTSWSIVDVGERWLTVSPMSGSYNEVITVTAQPNASPRSRSCSLMIKGPGIQREVHVSQDGKPVDDKEDGA